MHIIVHCHPALLSTACGLAAGAVTALKRKWQTPPSSLTEMAQTTKLKKARVFSHQGEEVRRRQADEGWEEGRRVRGHWRVRLSPRVAAVRGASCNESVAMHILANYWWRRACRTCPLH